MIEKMLQNFSGRIKNFPTPKNPFISVYEAISNSLQAIDKRSIKNGQIDIFIQRMNEPLTEGGIYPISSIRIVDNGIGFNDKNYASFKTFDSAYKQSIGGKGIGRLNWVKTFKNIVVKSTYLENEEFFYRDFEFNLNNEIELKEFKNTEEKNIKTSILLSGLKTEYYKKSCIDLEHIANKIIQHFTSYFVIGIESTINVHDGNKSICLNKFFKNDKYLDSKSEEVIVNKNTFDLKHVFLKTSPNSSHKIFVCAQNRVVTKISIPNIEELPSSFDIDNSKAIYQCFISGQFLDEDVNQERNEFNSVVFDKNNDEDLFGADLNLYNIVIEKITEYLDSYLEPYKLEKMSSLRDYIKNDAPEYSHLYNKKKEELQKISYATIRSKNKLKLELFKINQRINLDNYNAVNDFEIQDQVDESKIQEIMESITDIAKSELVSYVVKRKLVLQVLRKMLSYKDDETYYLESKLHNLFFPMKTDDSGIDYNQHNLWLIDERLSYSYKYFSDKQLKKVFEDSDSPKRPDGLFMDAVSFTDSSNGYADNITIIEFKRPGRDDYNSKDNPIDQVYDYIDLMINKNAKGLNGEIVNVDENTKFVAYIIADITKSLKREINKAKLQPTANNLTFFGYNDAYKVFIEVVPYSVILDNSVKRNEVFFNKISI
ncbi:MAG: ATP-binding protein [Candidatus Izemoplasmataceae bacterium]